MFNENYKMKLFLFYLPTNVDCNNWLKLIVSEQETCGWIAAVLIDGIVVELSDDDDVSKRKLSKPGGGPTGFSCDEQTRSLTCCKNISSNVFELSDSSFLLSIVVDDGVMEPIDDTNIAARSASVKL